ncbi:hypothetical protein SDC9_111924 [bioreactor metagenome]|uniref:Uncharacterized protein n=1 Tax=bioreactor metagenome TaxID=1076179 RepID=A0A645BID2_9ZZZZ
MIMIDCLFLQGKINLIRQIGVFVIRPRVKICQNSKRDLHVAKSVQLIVYRRQNLFDLQDLAVLYVGKCVIVRDADIPRNRIHLSGF